MNKNAMLTLVAGLAMSSAATAADIDGSITLGGGEYTWDTDGVEGNSKWHTRTNNVTEVNDASGGNKYDINYFGIDIKDGMFQFGMLGGKILSGQSAGRSNGHDIYLGDIALSVNTFCDFDNPTSLPNPTVDSSNFDFAIHLVSTNDVAGTAEFQLLTGGDWVGSNIYNNNHAPYHITETYRMQNATVVDTFTGAWTKTGFNKDTNVLEGEFDFGLLTSNPLGQNCISAYGTMTCVNDEVMVNSITSAVPEPSTYAMMLGGLGLVGLMAARRKKA